jgi:hypothetical protein
MILSFYYNIQNFESDVIYRNRSKNRINLLLSEKYILIAILLSFYNSFLI